MAADMTAAALIADGLCSANCLLAVDRDNRQCDCACRGRWHGVLGQAPVPETAAMRRPATAPQAGPALIDRSGALVDLDEAHREIDDLERLALETIPV